jgi:hypothetical protein
MPAISTAAKRKPAMPIRNLVFDSTAWPDEKLNNGTFPSTGNTDDPAETRLTIHIIADSGLALC